MRTLLFLLLACSLLAACQATDTTPESAQLSLRQTEEKIDIFYGDAPVLTYWIAPQLADSLPEHYRRSGFIHPIYSPAGRIVTDDFPVGHAHQHGLFMAWTKADFQDEFVDFWNQQKELGTVEHVAVLDVQNQADTASFTTRLQHRSLQHGIVLEEIWELKISAKDSLYYLDLASTQTNLTQDTLFLPEYHYGGFGLRGSKHWNQDDSLHFQAEAHFITSAGLSRDSANHSRPLWTAIYGPLEGDTAGMLIIDDPDNFRHPQPVRVHPEMPYLSMAPSVAGDFHIAPGETYRTKYRVMVFDGELPAIPPQ
ncbi:MAG: PmoA family protein [Bacteroidota bacterium]